MTRNRAAGGQATPVNPPERPRKAMPRSVIPEALGSVCSATGPLATGPGSAGWTSPLMDVRAVDPAGKPFPPGESAELQVHGVLLMRGYWGRPEATARAGSGGRHRSDAPRLGMRGDGRGGVSRLGVSVGGGRGVPRRMGPAGSGDVRWVVSLWSGWEPLWMAACGR
ncbi:AMP-binding protein [Thermocatellispora tengchongensis]|uniref:AMP-binding protein n=1 Tax=Thermocatellispora tengchongensis TaxID=1073253 RepID=UPI00160E0EA6